MKLSEFLKSLGHTIGIIDYEIIISGHPGEVGTPLEKDHIIVNHEAKKIWIDI